MTNSTSCSRAPRTERRGAPRCSRRTFGSSGLWTPSSGNRTRQRTPSSAAPASARSIHRFGEDVDITLDPIELGVTKSQRKKRGDRARAKLPEFLALTLVPHLEQQTEQLPEQTRPTIALDHGNEGHIRVHDPSVLEPSAAPPYIAESVLLELGARASTEPSQRAAVSTYLGELPQLVGQVAFPTATVNAMNLTRTFWEKATLIHFANTRNDRSAPAERYARHGYDLHALSQQAELVGQAISDRETLRLVLRVKHAHYGGKGVRYRDCGTGHLRLTTRGELRSRLEEDYGEMITANMFVQQPPTFEAIAGRLAELEGRIHAHLEGAPVTIEDGPK